MVGRVKAVSVHFPIQSGLFFLDAGCCTCGHRRWGWWRRVLPDPYIVDVEFGRSKKMPTNRLWGHHVHDQILRGCVDLFRTLLPDLSPVIVECDYSWFP